MLAVCACAYAIVLSGCSGVETNDLEDRVIPSNFRDWSPDLSILPSAEFNGNKVKVDGIRNCSYVTETDFVLDHYEATYDLRELKTVDFIVVPFQGASFLAHTMLSFGFSDGRYLAVSAEIRTERGETYAAMLGVSRQFEIMYVLADERDVIRLRTRHRNAEVYVYRTTADPKMARELFVDVMNRVNKLKQYPEFYDTILNNCTTNIVNHVNNVSPNSVPYGVQVLLPGFSDRYAYELGLLDKSVPFDELKRRARVNAIAELYYDDPNFSKIIRGEVAPPGLTAPRPIQE